MDKLHKQRQEELWDEFLRANPHNDELLYVIQWIEQFKERAGTLLLHRKPSENDLRNIAENVESLREEAAEMLFELNPVDCGLLRWGSDSIKKEVARNILAQDDRHLSDYDLRQIIENVPSLKTAAVKRLLSGDPTEADLDSIAKDEEMPSDFKQTALSLSGRRGKREILKELMMACAIIS